MKQKKEKEKREKEKAYLNATEKKCVHLALRCRCSDDVRGRLLSATHSSVVADCGWKKREREKDGDRKRMRERKRWRLGGAA